ncbi:MocR-like pyridoxine biosynthesis transcription factor PdxR [Streptomyces sp. NBC_00356]|uniref:MocR-like pyridoxine biosynthesis transcription factor PdxR n=1 Tax=Streptomyces sp. NBC_00356 TaxID=2975724 RepID=UPI002E26DC91
MPRTLIEIERGRGEPLYRQVRQAIEHGIASGRLDAGGRLPSSRLLAQELGVSRNTVTAAYQELVAEGFVESRARSGLFVNPRMPPRTEPEPTPPQEHTFDWSGRLRGREGDRLPHIEKHHDWARYPYPFPAGQVDPRAFPARAWVRSLNRALDRPHAAWSLQDCVADDDPLLVEMVRSHLLPARGMAVEASEVLITIGSQQGLDLLGRALLGPGSVAAVEDPGYLDARHIFLRAGARLHPLAVDADGLRPPETLRGVDLLHVTPSHHHPTNVTLGPRRRKVLLAAAREAGTVVVEDDYDSEFRYEGSPTPALKSQDTTGQVVYLGTFSKFLAPGLRLGYLVGSAELVAHLRELRRYSVRHPSGHLQRALGLLIESGDYQLAVRRSRARLGAKWRLMRDAVNASLPWASSPAPGGVSLWMSGPEGLDCRELARRARERGVLIERGDIFFLAGPEFPAGPDLDALRHFRVGFAAPRADVIEPGIAILGDVVRELLPPG